MYERLYVTHLCVCVFLFNSYFKEHVFIAISEVKNFIIYLQDD